MHTRHHLNTTFLASAALIALVALAGCKKEPSFNPREPARGPGGMVGLDGEINPGSLTQSVDKRPDARAITPPENGATPDCGAQCVKFCDNLNLQNPINRGMCNSTWGVGLKSATINKQEACRRLFVDVLGYFPTKAEVDSQCLNKGFGEVVSKMLRDDRFVMQQRKRWADIFRYDTEAVSVERIFDMDRLVTKLYQGLVSYDQFVAVASAHPVLTRRFDTPGDRAEALFNIFMGRPPLGSERSDIGRLYSLWQNGYYDHPQLGIRLPDAVLRYRCLTEEGEVDEASAGECTSILYGYNPLILKPDLRAETDNNGNRTMWSGLLKADEWAKLQMPGRLLAKDRVLWEKAVNDVLMQYLNYDIGTLVPKARKELVQTFIDNKGDIRAVHFAVLTSLAYLQSTKVDQSYSYRWSYGPLKQVDAEIWLDSIKHSTGYTLGTCDHRVNRPGDILESGTIAAWALVKDSNWKLNEEGQINYNHRNLAQSLGGCPSNDVGGRFKIISILTTATQLNYVNRVCDVGQSGNGVPIASLLPAGMSPNRAVTPDIAEQIVNHQTAMFYGRGMSDQEKTDARKYGEQCEREVCKAQDFARPSCFALLSSAEMLFY